MLDLMTNFHRRLVGYWVGILTDPIVCSDSDLGIIDKSSFNALPKALHDYRDLSMVSKVWFICRIVDKVLMWQLEHYIEIYKRCDKSMYWVQKRVWDETSYILYEWQWKEERLVTSVEECHKSKSVCVCH